MAIIAASCSKSATPQPATPKKTEAQIDAQLLVQNGDTTWTANSVTLYTGQNASGTATLLTDTNDFNRNGIFGLYKLTFKTDSVIVADWSYNGYGPVKWAVSGSKPAHLTIDFGKGQSINKVQVIDAQLVNLTQKQLTIIVNSTAFLGAASYKETFVASAGIVTKDM